MSPLNPMTSDVVMYNRCPNHCLVWCFASRWELNWCHLTWSDSIWCDSNLGEYSWCWFDSNQRDYNVQNFCTQLFSTSKLFLHPEFLKMMSPRGFSLISAPCHDALLSEKPDVPLMGSKRFNPLYPLAWEFMPRMVLGGFILMPALPLRNIHPLLTSVQLSRLQRDMFRSLCTHLSMVAVAWLELTTDGWLIVLSKHTPERPEGCKNPTSNTWGPSVIIGNEIFFTQCSWCELIGLSPILEWYLPSRLDISGILFS